MLRNALVRPGEPPRPSRGRPRKDGSPAQARTAATSGHATRDDPMPGSSDDHLRQTATETARRRLRSKQPDRRSLTDDETVSKRMKRETTIAVIKQEILKTVE